MPNPRLRFKKSDGTDYPDWEEKSFNDVFEFLNNNTFSRDMLTYENAIVKNIHYGDILIKFGNICDIECDNLPFIKPEFETSRYNLLKNGDIIIADTAEDDTVGKAIEIYNLNNNKVISGLHTMACRPIMFFSPKYLGYYMNSFVFHDQLRPYMQGIKVSSVNRKNIVNTMIKYPFSFEEQEKIADCLSAFDDLISIYNKQLKNLEELKKGVMQKIFSQEVRFKRADGTDYPDWENDILENICSIVDYRGKTPKKVKSGIFLVTAKNIRMGFIDYECSKEYILPSDYEEVMHRGKVKIGDVLITTEAPFGNVAQIDRTDIALAQRVIKYSAKIENLNNTYLKYYLMSENFQNILDILSTGGTVKGIKGSLLHKQSVSIPCLEEQEKIADCLSAFDEAIKIKKEQMKTAKDLKKGLLQQMFT